jgi:cbb3-type cytochrome oxidase subunit 3
MFDSSGTRRISRAAPCSVFDVRARIYVFFSRFALSVLTQTPLIIIIIIIIVSIYSRLNDTQEEHSEEEEEEEEHEDGTFKLCFVLVCSFVLLREKKKERERERF